MLGAIRSVMIFAEDPEKSARWWAGVLGKEVHLDIDGKSVYAWIDMDGLELGFHMSDEKNNPRGGSPVVYWSVDDLDSTRQRLLDAGFAHHRGPLQVELGRKICQLTDPFGTVIGLEGP